VIKTSNKTTIINLNFKTQFITSVSGVIVMVRKNSKTRLFAHGDRPLILSQIGVNIWSCASELLLRCCFLYVITLSTKATNCAFAYA